MPSLYHADDRTKEKVSGTFCLEAPAFGWGRVASSDRQMVPDTFSGPPQGISAVTATTIGAVPSFPLTNSMAVSGSDRLAWIRR